MNDPHLTKQSDEVKKVWEEIESLFGEHTDSFLLHYAIHKYDYYNDKKKGISVCESIQKHTNGHITDEVLDDIRIKSVYYVRILNPKTGDQIEKEIFPFFIHHCIMQFHPLILSLIHQHEIGALSSEKYHSTLEFLYHFLLVYNTIGERKMKKLNNIAYKYAYLIETDFDPERVDDCLSQLRGKLPSLDLFKNNFRKMRYSKHWPIESSKRKDCQLILRLIEEYISNQKISVKITVEHILPDYDSIDNTQIGNLICLEKNLNEQCAARPLAEKYDVYDRSALMCPREIARHYRDKEFSPSDRSDYLAELIYNEIFGFGMENTE